MPGKMAAPKAAPRPSNDRRILEARIKRLEEMIGRLNAKKAALEARLADPAMYLDTSKEVLEAALRDQAYLGKELGLLEGEWLEKQAALDLSST